MQDLIRSIPSAEVLLALPPEELGAKLLFLSRRRLETQTPNMGMVHPGSMTSEMESALTTGSSPGYPPNFRQQVLLALSEAWAWLEAQGLLIPALDINGRNGFRVLSRRAQAVENEADLAPRSAARMLPKDLLHPAIAAKAWMPFMRGDYDAAVFEAMKQLEILTRKAADQKGDLPAVQLVRKVFHEDTGVLTDPDAETSEKQALAHLFAGAFGVLKNPHSHRNVDLDDPADAAAAIMFASYLARVVEARVAALLLS